MLKLLEACKRKLPLAIPLIIALAWSLNLFDPTADPSRAAPPAEGMPAMQPRALPLMSAAAQAEANPRPPASFPEQAAEPRRVLLPTPTPTPPPTPGPANASEPASVAPLPAGAGRVALDGLSHEWQTWNNCGPATLSMALSFHGYQLGQATVGAVLRPNPEDKNVGPAELVAYAGSQGLAGLVRPNGDAAVLKRLLDSGFPVIVEVWLEPEPGNGFGHYRLLTGYDDEAQRWIAHDSYVGENLVNPDGAYQGIYVTYETLERQWRIFNRTFVVLFPADERSRVNDALRGHAGEAFMWHRNLVQTERELAADADDAFAWFNRGSALVGMGEYAAAAAAYDRAAAIGLPWRMLWYQHGPLAAYYATGRYQDVVSAADRTLAGTVDVEELHYWRGLALAALGDSGGARASWSTALSLRPEYALAQNALASLAVP